MLLFARRPANENKRLLETLSLLDFNLLRSLDLLKLPVKVAPEFIVDSTSDLDKVSWTVENKQYSNIKTEESKKDSDNFRYKVSTPNLLEDTIKYLELKIFLRTFLWLKRILKTIKWILIERNIKLMFCRNGLITVIVLISLNCRILECFDRH